MPKKFISENSKNFLQLTPRASTHVFSSSKSFAKSNIGCFSVLLKIPKLKALFVIASAFCTTQPSSEIAALVKFGFYK